MKTNTSFRFPVGMASRRAVLAFAGAMGASSVLPASAIEPQPAGDPRLNTHPDLAEAHQHLAARRWDALAAVVRRQSPDGACILLDDIADQSLIDGDLTGLTNEEMGATIAGTLLVNWGWRYRGSGLSSTVSEDMARAFEQRLRLARTHLETAVAANRNDGVAFNFMFRTLKGLSDVAAAQAAWSQFEAAERKPVRAYVSFGELLTPRWFGSEELVLGYARAQQAVLEPTSHALIAWAANEHIMPRWRRSLQEGFAFASSTVVLGEVGAANNAFNAGQADGDVYRAQFAHGHFAFFFWFVGLHDLARPHLIAMGDHVAAPWARLGDPFEALRVARELAGISAT